MARTPHHPDVVQGTDLLARWVGERAGLIAHAATEEIWHEVPSYRRQADSSLRSEVEAHTRLIFGAFLTTLRERRDPAPADFPWTAGHAMRRVELGIVLPDFMSAFRVSQLTLWDDILEGVRARPDTQAAALQVVRQVMRTIEVGSSVAALAYVEAQQYRLADSARVARDLLEDLLAGHPPSVLPRRDVLIELGLDEDAPFVVVVAGLDAPGKAVGEVRRLLSSARRGLVVDRQDEVVAVFPETGESAAELREVVRGVSALLAARDIFPAFGLSSVQRGWGAVPDAVEEAQHARRSLGDRGGVQAVEDMTTLDFLVHAQGDCAARLVRPAVRAFLLEDLQSHGVFVETLRAYVAANLNAKEAALALHVHANTVYYRLERIAERTGCDVRRVEELIDLLLAVRLVRGE